VGGRAGLLIPFTIQHLLPALLSAAAAAQTIGVAQLDEDLLRKRMQLVDSNVPERLQRLRSLLQQAGCSDLQEQPVKRSKEPNLICTIPASQPNARTIIIGAHFDFKGGIGVVDNWTGAVLLPTLAELMRKQPRRHGLRFVGFASEEHGLRGSKSYVKAMSEAERRQVAAFVGIDAMGLQPTHYWPRGSTPELVSEAQLVADSMKLELGRWNLNGLGTTDSESFRKAGIPVISFHSLTREKWSMINSKRDGWDALSWKEYWDSSRLIATLLLHLDQKLP
jgi:hypothetical protein